MRCAQPPATPKSTKVNKNRKKFKNKIHDFWKIQKFTREIPPTEMREQSWEKKCDTLRHHFAAAERARCLQHHVTCCYVAAYSSLAAQVRAYDAKDYLAFGRAVGDALWKLVGPTPVRPGLRGQDPEHSLAERQQIPERTSQ